MEPSAACTPLTTALAGQIAVVDLGGECNLVDKAEAAFLVGATAVVVVNSNTKPPITSMTGNFSAITIPVVIVSKDASELFESGVGANLTIGVAPTSGPGV